MSRITTQFMAMIATMTALVADPHSTVRSLMPARTQRGGGSSSMETLIIVGAIALLATAVIVIVRAFVLSKDPSGA
ncbi:Uncharacterised protein [Mycobacteroides abscessus subsp. abscessus]|nr:Uncharacterised protein [Mycobacteroides abscessus subsp. abscessus]